MTLALYYGGGGLGFFSPLYKKPKDKNFELQFCERLIKRDPNYTEVLAFLGNSYTVMGKYKLGEEYDLRLVRLRPNCARAHYNLACTHALLNKREDAFKTLERAVELGFRDAEHMANDDDLASLHNDVRFTELLAFARMNAVPYED